MTSEKMIEEFLVPSRGTWTAFLICELLLSVWLGLELMFVNALLAGEHPKSGKEGAIIVVWTLACIPLLVWLVWLVFGRERITFRKSYLTIRNEIAGLGLPFPWVGKGLAFNYDAEAITDIRLGKLTAGDNKGLIAAPRIEFSYRGSTIGFGSGLQPLEALNIISIAKKTYHIG